MAKDEKIFDFSRMSFADLSVVYQHTSNNREALDNGFH